MRTETAIRKSIGDLTFLVREVAYEASAEVSRPVGPLRMGARIFHDGRESVDRVGQAYLRGAAFSVGAGGAGNRWEGRLSAGWALDEREVRGGAVVRARAAWRGDRWGWRLRLDALDTPGGWKADLGAGPSLRLLEGEVFAEWLRLEHPLGLQVRGLAVGYRTVPGEVRAARPGSSGRVRGDVGAGAGGGAGGARRWAGLRLSFPLAATGPEAGWLADFDAQVLTGPDPGELYYVYHVGWDRPYRGGRFGVYLHHRSNHLLAEPNDRITSINVLEAGVERGRRFSPYDHRGRDTRWSYRARAGWLATSSFGERRRWHALASGRWVARPDRRGSAFLEAVVEAGDVGRRQVAAGWRGRTGVAELVWLRDGQFFSANRSAWLLRLRRRVD